MTTLGGKADWPPASRLLFQSHQSVSEEAFPPLADNLPRGIQPRGNHIIAQTLGSKENDLRANDISIR
jgi:hypothetical protein